MQRRTSLCVFDVPVSPPELVELQCVYAVSKAERLQICVFSVSARPGIVLAFSPKRGCPPDPLAN